jgi:hypothetical protein
MEKTSLKLTESELSAVKAIKAEYNELVIAFGEVEVQKLRLVEVQKDLANREGDLAKQLQDKYGQGSINIETGEIS